MYLALLKENEKEQFLSLAVALACTDGDFGKEEHFMITQYCDEMGVEDHIPVSYTHLDVYKRQEK